MLTARETGVLRMVLPMTLQDILSYRTRVTLDVDGCKWRQLNPETRGEEWG